MRAKPVFILLTLFANTVLAQERPEPSPFAGREAAEPSAATWIKASLTSFETDVPTHEELNPLLRKLSSARLIGLGESTHGDHQSQVFKSQVIRRLIADQKLDQLVFEINRSAGQALDDYVNLGKGDLTDVIRNQGVFKIWQTDDFASLIGWIRGYVVQTKKKIHIYGIDCQMPAKDLKFAMDFLRRKDRRAANHYGKIYSSLFDSDKQGKTYLAWLKSRRKGDYAKFADPAKAIIQQIDNYKAEPGYQEAAYSALTAWQAFNSFEFSFGPQPEDFSKLKPDYLSRRDRFMGANLLRRVGSKRACLWAHDGHVTGELPEEFTKAGYASLGWVLKQALKTDYVTVGFTWSTGVIHAKVAGGNSPDLVALQKASIPQVAVRADRKGDLGEFLGRLGIDHFYVDLRNADDATKRWGRLSYYRPSLGWLFDPTKFLTDLEETSPTIPSHDILVYSRKISPSTLWVFP